MTKLDTLLLSSNALSSREPKHIEIDDIGDFVDIEDDVVFLLKIRTRAPTTL